MIKKHIKKILIGAGLLGVASAATISQIPLNIPIQSNVDKILSVSSSLIGIYTNSQYNETIEVKDIVKNKNGEIQLYARAWKGGIPLGLGKSQVEWERFIFSNPPVLVLDPNGSITKTWTEPDGVVRVRHQREDPLQSIKDELAHAIYLTSSDKLPISGTYGHTTYTYYPGVGNGVDNTADGDVCYINDPGTTWEAIKTHSGNAAGPVNSCYSGTNIMDIRWQESAASTWKGFQRDEFSFNATTTTGTITSATISLYGAASGNNENNNPNFGIYKPFGQINATNINAADYNQSNWESDLLSTSTWPYPDFTVGAYMDLGLKQDGINNINSTTTSSFGARNQNYDVADVIPANTGTGDFYIEFYQSDFGSNQPKLTIVTNAGGGGGTGGVNTHRKFILIDYEELLAKKYI